MAERESPLRRDTTKEAGSPSMLKIALTAALSMLIIPASHASAIQTCIAVNPGQTTCSYIAQGATEGSATGVGAWKVTVKHGRHIITYTPNGYYGEPTVETFTIHKGDKVTAKALDAGSVVVVGGP